MSDQIKAVFAKKSKAEYSTADHYLANHQLLNLIESTNTGLWERHIITNAAWWSPKFCELLGYGYGELELSYSFFIERLVHPDDKKLVYNAFQNHLKNNSIYKVEFRALTKTNGYCWFESSGKAWKDGNGNLSKMIGSISDIDKKKRLEIDLKRSEFLLTETSKIANIGGWELDIKTGALTWSREKYPLHAAPATYMQTIAIALKFFEPGYHEIITRAVTEAIEQLKPYDLELRFRKRNGKVIWVRKRGIPIADSEGRCIALRGIFQDIDEEKIKELNLKESLDLLSDQNKRLQNFAYIVSHNLRSHSGNLQALVGLYNEDAQDNERQEIFGNIKAISESLASTIDHLNEIVRIQTEINKELRPVSLYTVFSNTQNALDSNITETKAIICFDFFNCPVVDYVPAYMESIFLNLMTNALKYRHPDRAPRIVCESYVLDDMPYLTFEDNGLGIDMEKYGDKVFGMYKTFHHNANAKGLGLFITRNQVEALGGKIKIESKVNIGTKFTIKLA